MKHRVGLVIGLQVLGTGVSLGLALLWTLSGVGSGLPFGAGDAYAGVLEVDSSGLVQVASFDAPVDTPPYEFPAPEELFGAGREKLELGPDPRAENRGGLDPRSVALTPVPEPSTGLLCGGGIVALAALRRRVRCRS